VTRRYTDAEREEAALICAIAASGGVYREWSGDRGRAYSNIATNTDASNSGLTLAIQAYLHVLDVTDSYWTREVDAEAEALIRTGWTPTT